MCCKKRKVTAVLTVNENKQRKSGLAAKIVAVLCASCVAAGGIGFGIASAGSDHSQDAAVFGIDAQQISASSTSVDTKSVLTTRVSDTSAREAIVLTSAASRDITKGIQAIEAQEEAERIAAEEARRAEEAERIAAAEAAKAAQQAAAAQEAASSALDNLPDVDWNVGKDAFIAEWGARIDAYLAGSPLSGQGETFATAAWNNSVDPRWSPAISNTESSKGAVCFLPYNAWGWGSSSWGNWEDAINAHVAGLAKGYGYSITYANAVKYCPPNSANWFNNTVNQMCMI